MKIKQLEDDKFLVRFDRGEEILAAVGKIAEEYDIKLGTVTGLGAVNEITVGLFCPDSKTYASKDYAENFEIVSLVGNISRMDGKVYLHFHGSFGNEEYNVIGGHINKAVVSATAEIIIEKLNGEMGRRFDEGVGLNLLDMG